MHFWPIIDDGNTHPWNPNGIRVLHAFEAFQKPFVGTFRYGILFTGYFKALLMENIHAHYYKTTYNIEPGCNKVPFTSPTSTASAIVMRTNFLDLIPLYYPASFKTATQTYALTSTEFLHVLNNLFPNNELTTNVKNSLSFMGMNVGTGASAWGWFPDNVLFGRTCFTDPAKMVPIFDILCNHSGENGGKFITMDVRIPLSVQYIAFGSILKTICGFETLSKTPPVVVNNVIKRRALSIIYNARQNAFISPASIEKITVTDLVSKNVDKDFIIATPNYNIAVNTIPKDITQRHAKFYQWSFPQIPPIDGVENDYKSLLTTKSADSTYDYIRIESQHPLNPYNAGDTHLYTTSTFLKWTHIGNHESPLVATIPTPVYGFGLANLELNKSKTVDIADAAIQLEYEMPQLEFKTIVEGSLVNFNINPRNAYGDRVQIPTLMDTMPSSRWPRHASGVWHSKQEYLEGAGLLDSLLGKVTSAGRKAASAGVKRLGNVAKKKALSLGRHAKKKGIKLLKKKKGVLLKRGKALGLSLRNKAISSAKNTAKTKGNQLVKKLLGNKGAASVTSLLKKQSPSSKRHRTNLRGTLRPGHIGKHGRRRGKKGYHYARRINKVFSNGGRINARRNIADKIERGLLPDRDIVVRSRCIMGTKKKERSAARKALKDYKHAEKASGGGNILSKTLLHNNGGGGSSSSGANAPPPNPSTLRGSGIAAHLQKKRKLFELRDDPESAFIPHCTLTPPFHAFRNNKRRKMDTYEWHTYQNTIAKKLKDIDSDFTMGGNGGEYLKGSGLIPADPNVKEALGTQAPISNIDVSDAAQQEGSRNIGGSAEPGAEKLIYEPTIKVASIYESIAEVVIPASNRNPGITEYNIYFNIPQQAPAFMDRRTFCFEFDLQCFRNNALIVNDLTPARVWSNYVSFVNNLVPSLFKDIDFQINQQHLSMSTFNYAFGHHMADLLFSEQNREVKGDFIDQCFIFEASGELGNQYVVLAAGAEPACRNKKALKFFTTLLQGKTLKCRFYPYGPFMGNSLLSMANAIGITMQRNPEKFYMCVADWQYFDGINEAAKKQNQALAVTFAKTLKLNLTNVQCRFYRYELNQKHVESLPLPVCATILRNAIRNHGDIRTYPAHAHVKWKNTVVPRCSKGIVQINRSFNSESKMKDSCGCTIIIPVTGFECYLCKMFIRNENDIEDHIASFQHLTIYEIHLQEHNQVQDSINPNQIDANGKCLADEIISISNDNLKERNTVENSSERNLLHDGIRPEENDAVGRNAEEPTSKRTVLNGNDRELSKSNMVDATEVSRIGDLGMQNFDGNLSNNQAPPCNGQEHDASGNIKKHCFDESDSDQIARDSRCNTLMDEAEREGRFDGGQVKLEVSDGNDIELRRNLPTTKEHAKDNDQCNNGKISLEGTEDVCETFIKEEQHDDCHDDDGDADGIIEGFLEDSFDDTHDNDEHCNGELMPEYTYNRESPTDSIQPCATATTTSGEQCQPTVTSQSRENQAETTYTDEISETGIEMNLEISRDVNSNINTCVDTEHPQKEPNQRLRSSLPMPIALRNKDKDESHHADKAGIAVRIV
eukprot:Seg2628.13 transcript_id=Seg2628.13/GoldUCD/mRNA.D3Y31 product="hypothetical protein" protein_id=Seg2628.13/GoldUCD/D3Y31